MRLPRLTFRLRLMLLVLLAVLPALGLVVYASHEEQGRALKQAERETTVVGQVVQGQIERSIFAVVGVLQTVGRRPNLDAITPADCTALFPEDGTGLDQDLRQRYIATPDGTVLCGDRDLPRGSSVTNIDAFQLARERSDLAIGRYALDRTGAPVIPLAGPVVGPDGALKAIVGAAFDVVTINEDQTLSGLPDRSVILVVDRDGVILYSIPGGLADAGEPLAEPRLRELVRGQGATQTLTVKAADGIERLYALGPFAVGGPNPPYFVVGQPTAAVFADADAALQRNLIGLAVAAVLALGAAWLIGDVLFLRRVKGLVAGTRAVAAGNLSTRVATRGNDELTTLARSFNEMTEALSTSREETGQKEDQFRGLFEAATDGVLVCDSDTGRVIEANPAAGAVLGCSRDRLIGMHPFGFIAKDSQPSFGTMIEAAFSSQFHGRGSFVRGDGTTFIGDITGTGFMFDGHRQLLFVVRDVTEQVAAEHLLEERVADRTRELSALLEVARSVGSTLELRPLMAAILAQLNHVVDYSGATLTTFDGECLTVLESRAGDNLALVSRAPTAGLRFKIAADHPFWGHMAEDRGVIINDVLGDSGDAALFRGTLGVSFEDDPESIGSWMAVSLMVKGKAVGMLSASRPEKNFFDESHLSLARAIAAQASIAIENARLFAETKRRALESETLARIASDFTMGGELQPALEMLAHRVVEATRAVAAAVAIIDGGQIAEAGSEGYPAGFLDLAREAIAHGAASPIFAAMDHQAILRFPDTPATLQMAPGWAEVGAILADVEWKNMVVVPLIYRGQAIGAISLGFVSNGDPSTEDEAFLRAIADQAAVGIENSRLFARAQRSARENAALAAIASDVALDQPLSATLDAIAANVAGASGAVSCAIHLAGQAGALEVAGGFGLPGWYRESVAARPAISPGTLRHEAITTGEPVVQRHALARIRAYPENAALVDAIDHTLWETLVVLPVRYRGEPFGALTIAFKEDFEPSADDLRLLTAVSDQSALAIANARLFAQAQRSARENAALASIAANVTLDQPMRATLDAIAANTLAATDAAACGVILVDVPGDRIQLSGGAGLAPGFVDLMESIPASDTFSVEALRSGQQIFAEGARTRMLANPSFASVHTFLEQAAWEHILIVPVRYRGRPIGALNVAYAAGTAPTPAEREMLKAIADQAAIAMENVRLFDQSGQRVAENARLYAEAERRAAEQEAVASIASAITYDRPLKEVLDTLAANVCAGTGALACAVLLVDDAHGASAVGECGIPGGYFEAMIAARNGWPDYWREMNAETEITVTRDARQFIRTHPAYGPVRPYIQDVDWDCVVRVPVAYGGSFRGSVVIYLPGEVVVGEAEKRFYRAIADQAAAAVENARLFSAVEERTRQLQSLYRADEVLHRSLQLEDVTKALLDVVVDTLGADDASLILWEPDAIRPRVLTSRVNDPQLIEIVEASLAREGRRPFAATAGHVSVIEDTAPAAGEARRRTADIGIGAALETGLLVDGQFFGLLDAIYMQPRRFSQDEVRLFTSLAKRAALAIENAQLYAQAQALAAVEERQRLARELHDSVSQALYGIALGAKTARTLLDRDPARAIAPVDYVVQLAEAGLAEMRALIFELRPESLATEGLVAALQKQVDSLRARYGLAVDAGLPEEPEAPFAVKEAIYRVAQEALHNVVKHARAQRVTLSLGCEGEALVLVVADDGQGFDPGGDFPGHLGLRSMRERVERLGGQLTLTSAPGEGSRLAVRLAAPPAATKNGASHEI
ncbi:MAG: GAF domain-containing protein [Dehalococcoidia bacterium]